MLLSTIDDLQLAIEGRGASFSVGFAVHGDSGLVRRATSATPLDGGGVALLYAAHAGRGDLL